MEDDTKAADADASALEPIGDTKVSTAMGVSAIAMTMALRYHDINTVQDGALYQQYKLEGKNFRDLHLDVVFETAMQIELHLLNGERRIAKMIADSVVDAMSQVLEEELEKPDPEAKE